MQKLRIFFLCIFVYFFLYSLGFVISKTCQKSSIINKIIKNKKNIRNILQKYKKKFETNSVFFI